MPLEEAGLEVETIQKQRLLASNSAWRPTTSRATRTGMTAPLWSDSLRKKAGGYSMKTGYSNNSKSLQDQVTKTMWAAWRLSSMRKRAGVLPPIVDA
jgi:hypothetical protein